MPGGADDQLWGSGRGAIAAIAGCHCNGAIAGCHIAGCHCVVVVSYLEEWTWLQGAIVVCYGWVPV